MAPRIDLGSRGLLFWATLLLENLRLLISLGHHDRQEAVFKRGVLSQSVLCYCVCVCVCLPVFQERLCWCVHTTPTSTPESNFGWSVFKEQEDKHSSPDAPR
ncbi:hypothetical protein XENOCAPTIV_006581 [Xenoophorus captivus]|uniref:Secreted protein n=1 Tax=Xenoophorus captivus TaxID=1517983 RepID=A0ABV0QYY1_9TELE